MRGTWGTHSSRWTKVAKKTTCPRSTHSPRANSHGAGFRLHLEGDSLRTAVELMGSCYPRSQKRDLGHPLVSMDESGEKNHMSPFDSPRANSHRAGFRLHLADARFRSGRHPHTESMWAYLPVGPLERHFWEGYQGGFWEEVPKNPQVRVTAFLWRDVWGSLC